MSAKQGNDNFEKFMAFVSEREKEGDWEDFVGRNGLELNKSKMAKEAGLKRRQVFVDNAQISAKLKEQELLLRKRGVLGEDKRSATEKAEAQNNALANAMDKKRLKNTSEKNATLQQELYEKDKEIQKLKADLERVGKVKAYMEATGRW